MRVLSNVQLARTVHQLLALLAIQLELFGLSLSLSLALPCVVVVYVWVLGNHLTASERAIQQRERVTGLMSGGGGERESDSEGE